MKDSKRTFNTTVKKKNKKKAFKNRKYQKREMKAICWRDKSWGVWSKPSSKK